MYDFCLMPSKNTYAESLKYKTLMFEGVSGDKSSRPLLSEPKRVVRYSALAFFTNKHAQFLNGFMEGLTFKVLHPLWGRSEVISGSVGQTINCTLDNSDMVIGEKVFVITGTDKYDIYTITGIGVGSITVSEAVSVSAGQLLLPSFEGIMTGSIDSNYTGENYAVCTINIEELR